MKHDKSIEGSYYCTSPDDSDGEGCIACGVCYQGASEFFESDDDGFAYVKKQPGSSEEIAQCKEMLDTCPVVAIGNNG